MKKIKKLSQTCCCHSWPPADKKISDFRLSLKSQATCPASTASTPPTRPPHPVAKWANGLGLCVAAVAIWPTGRRATIERRQPGPALEAAESVGGCRAPCCCWSLPPRFWQPAGEAETWPPLD